jgi:predicted Zn-dependent protease
MPSPQLEVAHGSRIFILMRMKNTRKVLIVVSIAGLLLLAGGGYPVYKFAHQAYRLARQAHLIKQARNYLAKPDEPKALLFLQRALRYNSKDVEACRLMAELAERTRSPGAFLWRSRVVELNPCSVDDRLALAQTALTFGDYASAIIALEGVDAAGKKTAAYHNIAGAVAAASARPARAEAHFLEVTRLEPQNAVPQLNLAVVRLLSTNEVTLADARTTLRRISANPTNSTLRCQALRELAADALRHKQADTALALSIQLLLETNSVFADRLLHLNDLQETRNAEFSRALADFQREATQGTNAPVKIYELALWQIAKTGPKDALAWLNSLPRITQTNHPAAFLIADCQILLQDWWGLQVALDQQNWGELEFLRHALLARGCRGRELTAPARDEWSLALKAALNQEGSHVMLLRLATQWNWRTEQIELLWLIVNYYPNEKWAALALKQGLFAGGQTPSLMKLFSLQAKRSPADLDVKNDLAICALLLKAKELNPHELAREVYQKAPTNASYASTYAFSLYLQEKHAEALKVMQQLKPIDLENPSIAGYYGLILQATGSHEKARLYFQRASKARLLPEEQKLFDRARAGP